MGIRVGEASRLLDGVAARTHRRLAEAGIIEAKRVGAGGHWRFAPSSISRIRAKLIEIGILDTGSEQASMDELDADKSGNRVPASVATLWARRAGGVGSSFPIVVPLGPIQERGETNVDGLEQITDRQRREYEDDCCQVQDACGIAEKFIEAFHAVIGDQDGNATARHATDMWRWYRAAMDVGKAIMRIRGARVWREEHAEWSSLCFELGITPERADQLIGLVPILEASQLRRERAGVTPLPRRRRTTLMRREIARRRYQREMVELERALPEAIGARAPAVLAVLKKLGSEIFPADGKQVTRHRNKEDIAEELFNVLVDAVEKTPARLGKRCCSALNIGEDVEKAARKKLKIETSRPNRGGGKRPWFWVKDNG